jgi:hypothetical protein
VEKLEGKMILPWTGAGLDSDKGRRLVEGSVSARQEIEALKLLERDERHRDPAQFAIEVGASSYATKS